MITGLTTALVLGGNQSGIGLPHSKTLRSVCAATTVRQLLECGSPVPLLRSLNTRLSIARWVLGAAVSMMLLNAAALEIQLPPETGAFKQDKGAEIANGQCLVCHSVEYVVIQPPMPRAFWKASIQKMQQKYGAPIPDDQVEALTDYLVKNYGIATNGAPGTSPAPVASNSSDHPAAGADGPKLAARLGCFGCHSPTTKVVGPAYKDIAAKYKADPQALAKIDEQIHKGGSGKWGPVIMPPFPQVTPAETKALSEWILGLK